MSLCRKKRYSTTSQTYSSRFFTYSQRRQDAASGTVVAAVRERERIGGKRQPNASIFSLHRRQSGCHAHLDFVPIAELLLQLLGERFHRLLLNACLGCLLPRKERECVELHLEIAR